MGDESGRVRPSPAGYCGDVKLLVISHTEHYRRGGQIVGWGATVREIDHLASLFERVVHIAPLHPGPAPESAIPYQAGHVELIPVPPAGGRTLGSKPGILWRIPRYVRVILRELRRADAVHVRCPANISLVAIVLLALLKQPRTRWIKYAGNWSPQAGEAWSYRFQRWWLRRNFVRGVVTVNGEWPDQPEHVVSFLNPCLTDEELEEGRAAAAGKHLREPLRLIVVGRVEQAKGIGRALDVVSLLTAAGVSVCLDVVGDSPERARFEQQARQAGIEARVRFHGALPRTALPALYRDAHFVLLPSSSEGWPKVLSEAMAYGAVPLASAVGSVPDYLARFGTGRALDPDDIRGYVEAIRYYAAHPDEWKGESTRSAEAAAAFSYRAYLHAVQRLPGMPAQAARVDR